MLTIGELARYAGVTTRAVRHYHSRGLLAEPARDHAGYRRYDAQAVVELIRIKTLAEAGVPLARVADLLRAGPDAFAEAVAALDRDLLERIRALHRSRERVKQLAAGDAIGLPPEVVRYLDRLRALGASERGIQLERDAWIILAAQAPHRIESWIEQKHRDLDDPIWPTIYLTLDEAADWDPDDPRLPELADKLDAAVTAVYVAHPTADSELDDLGEPLIGVLDAHTIESFPAWVRLRRLLEERGWSGWTRIARSGDRPDGPAGRGAR